MKWNFKAKTCVESFEKHLLILQPSLFILTALLFVPVAVLAALPKSSTTTIGSAISTSINEKRSARAARKKFIDVMRNKKRSHNLLLARLLILLFFGVGTQNFMLKLHNGCPSKMTTGRGRGRE